MFKVVATIIITLASGQSHPAGQLRSHTTFETRAACEDFANTQEGAFAKQQLETRLQEMSEPDKTFSASYACEQVQEKDDSI